MTTDATKIVVATVCRSFDRSEYRVKTIDPATNQIVSYYTPDLDDAHATAESMLIAFGAWDVRRITREKFITGRYIARIY